MPMRHGPRNCWLRIAIFLMAKPIRTPRQARRRSARKLVGLMSAPASVNLMGRIGTLASMFGREILACRMAAQARPPSMGCEKLFVGRARIPGRQPGRWHCARLRTKDFESPLRTFLACAANNYKWKTKTGTGSYEKQVTLREGIYSH